MNWITGIQRAIDYVEEHLTEPIDYGKVAEQAYSSSFHFQRIFSTICGFTLGDYIRFRRLSLAGRELAERQSKVIDVALKYGYDTPESFSRAFTRFHGVSPTEAKNGAVLKNFLRLSVKLTLDGGTTMDYRIEKKEAFQVVMRKKTFPKNFELTSREIPELWGRCHAEGTTQKLVARIPEDDVFGLMGMSIYDREAADFCYGIGVSYDGKEVDDENLSIVEIPANTFVVFKCVGQMPDAFQKLYKFVVTEFFPTSDYQPAGVEIEAYPSDDVQNPDYTCELWIAVEKK